MKENKEIKLLPCPFCGNFALDCNGHFIECDKCGATSPKVYPVPEHEIVYQLWNTRPDKLEELDEESIIDCFQNYFGTDPQVREEWRLHAKAICARFGKARQERKG